MPNKFTLTIDTGDLVKKFQDLPEEVNRQLVGKVLRVAMEPMRRLARYYAPVHTGRMAAGIKMKAGKQSKTRVTMVITAGPPGHLAEEGFRHAGTGQQVEGSHFLERAFEEAESEMVATVEELLQDAVSQYFAK